MSNGILYAYPGSLRAAKIQIAAEYSGSKLTNAEFEFGKTNATPEFLQKFPLGKVPAFHSDEVCLSETDAIASYVANEQLKGGKSAVDQALVTQYVAFSNNEVTPSACTWTFPCLGFKGYNKADTAAAQEHLKKCFSLLNDTLLTKTFLVGERVSLADITLCCDLVCLYKLVLDPKFRAPYGNLNRWFMTCVNQPQFKKVLGEVKMAESMAQFDNKKFAELHPKPGKKDAPKKEGNKDAPKKEQKKEAAPPAEAPTPKAVCPFKKLAPTTLVLDEWKKMYKNNEIEVSMEWLDKNIDLAGYSFWHGAYDLKYCEDFKYDFQASNLGGGLQGRIEGMRKNAMGVILVLKYEEAPQFRIETMWMFRGQELGFELDENWNIDAPSFKHTKMDYNNVEDKLRITRFLAGDAIPELPVHDYMCYV